MSQSQSSVVNSSGVTFAVSNVQSDGDAVRRTDLRSALEKVLAGKVESCSTPGASVVDHHGFHALFEAVHRAYDEHRSLVLSPDDIWLVVCQGFAACVNQDPEAYRSKFVAHDGKETIIVRRDEFVMGAFDNDWRGCFPEFSARIREHVGDQTHGLIVSDFSTTGDIERAASEVVLMDVVQSYFEFVVYTKCGIRNVTLRGTPDDWDSVAAKTRALLPFGGAHLEAWLKAAIPVVEEFAKAARGEVDLDFWEELYKGRDSSGGIYANGYILRLFPYVRDSRGGALKANPLLSGGSSWGISVSSLPPALSCVPFIWDYLGTKFDYQFLAGHVAVDYDESTESYSPVMGWAVRPKAK